MARKAARPKQKSSETKITDDCCSEIDLCNWPTTPACSGPETHRWGAILFCGDIQDQLFAFSNTLGVIYKTLTESLHMRSDNIRVLYHGPNPTTYSDLQVVGPGTKANLEQQLEEADSLYDVLIVVLMGHGMPKVGAQDAGLICALEVSNWDKVRRLMPTCHPNKALAELRKTDDEEIPLSDDVLTPRELTCYLSSMHNCLSHVAVHSCGSGIFAEIAKAASVSSFTSATSRDGVMLLCDNQQHWQAPFVWAYNLALAANERPLRSAFEAAHLGLALCPGSRCTFFV